MAEIQQDANLTPLQLTQLNTVKTIFKIIDLDAKEEINYRTGSQKMIRRLVSLLYKYMSETMRNEIAKLYEELDEKCKGYDKDTTLDEKTTRANKRKAEQMIAEKVFDMCAKALVNSPLIEESIEVDASIANINREEFKKSISSKVVKSILE